MRSQGEGGTAMIIPSHRILEMIGKGELITEGFRQDRLQPGSYDIALGTEAFVTSTTEKIAVDKRGVLVLQPGEFSLVISHEVLSLPLNVAGHIGIRSEFARRGMLLLSGPQVDPGFEGNLHLGLVNLSPSEIALIYQGPFATIVFHQMVEAAKEGYRGRYQGQRAISSEELSSLASARGMTFGQVVQTLSAVSRDVGLLTASVGTLSDRLGSTISLAKWVGGFFIGFLTIAITAIAIIVALK